MDRYQKPGRVSLTVAEYRALHQHIGMTQKPSVVGEMRAELAKMWPQLHKLANVS